jgi:membrane-associated protease RseP (regulator of RpoE activity)
MRLSQVLRPAWSLAALGLALSLLVAPMAARADDDDDDKDNGQGTVRIYGRDNDDAARGGYLGVQVQDVTRALQRARNLPTDQGALVSRVESDSPADRNGIRRGDVIVEVDRKKVEDSGDLIRAVRDLEPGSQVRVTLWRAGSLRTVNVPLGERPAGQGMMPPNMRMPSGVGDDVMPLPPGGPGDREVRQQIRELQDQIRQLQDEIRSLRQELRRSRRDNDDNDRNDDD